MIKYIDSEGRIRGFKFVLMAGIEENGETGVTLADGTYTLEDILFMFGRLSIDLINVLEEQFDIDSEEAASMLESGVFAAKAVQYMEDNNEIPDALLADRERVLRRLK